MFRVEENPARIESNTFNPCNNDQIKNQSNEQNLSQQYNGHHQVFSFPTIGPNTSGQDAHFQPNIVVQIPIHSTSQSSQHGQHLPRHPFNHPPNRASNEVIKSEPIKFEQDPSSSRASPCATVTSSTTVTTQIPQIKHMSMASHSNRNMDLSSLVTARPKNASIKCLRCPHCPFISIHQSALNEHTLAQHQQGQLPTQQWKKLACPGCENVFYSRTSLETHLANDHQMSEIDIRLLLQNVFEGVLEVEESPSVCVHDQHTPTTPNKQKIYLKNVEVLKNPFLSFHNSPPTSSSEPQTQSHLLKDNDLSNEMDPYKPFEEFESDSYLAVPIEEFQNGVDPNAIIDLIDDYYNDTAEDIYASIAEFQNKIFVKDDMTLKNPIQFFESDTQQYQSQTSGTFKDIQDQQINVIETPPPECLGLAPNVGEAVRIQNRGNEQIFLQKFSGSTFGFGQDQKISSSTRKPCKIFIKNVDILKKPMFVQSCSSNSMSPQPTYISSLPATTTTFNHLPFPYLSTTSLNSLSNDTSTDLPPSNHQPKKIFIKNIDILKEPSTFPLTQTFNPSPMLLPVGPPEPEVRRNTLHLRTVDQLNLMNLNEVQNLIENFQEEPSPPTKPQPVQDYSENLYNYMPDFTPQTENCLDTMLQDLEDYRIEPDKFPYPIQMIHNPRHHQDPDTLQPSISEHFQFTNKHQTDESIESPSSSETQITNKLEPAVWTEWQGLENDTSSSAYQTTDKYFDIADSTGTDLCTNPLIDLNKSIDEDMLYVCAQEIINCDEQTLIEDVEMGIVTSLQAEETPPDPKTYIQLETVSEAQISHIQGQTLQKLEQQEPSALCDPYLKGRIYVLNNLMKPAETPVTVTADGSPSPVVVDESNDDESDAEVDKDATEDEEHIEVGVDSEEPAQPSDASAKRYKKRATGRRLIESDNSAIHSCSLNCAMKFRSPDLLKYHQRCHGSDPANPMICPECPAASPSSLFRAWNSLHTHLWRSHAIDMELYSCTKCKFKTPNRSRLLNTHSLTHSDERNYKCTECDKAFKNARQLKNHKRTHTVSPDTTHQCTQCNEVFLKPRNLRQHIRKKHEAAEQYQCSICGATCSSMGARRTHMANHEKAKAKAYQCPDCEYSSNDTNAIRRHRKTHTAQPSYRCPICDNGYAQSTSYTHHVLKEHPVEAKDIVFSCDECKFTTINRRKFDLHHMNHISGSKRAAKPSKPTIEKAVDLPSETVDVAVDVRVDGGVEVAVGDSGADGNFDFMPNRIKVRSGLKIR